MVNPGSLAASDTASRPMTSPRGRVTHWAVAFGFVAWATLAQIGAARAQYFDPFSQFFAPQAPAYTPQAPAYTPPRVYRRGARVSRWSRPALVSVPDRPRVRPSRAPERVRHVRVPRHIPARIRLASLPSPALVQKRRSSEPSAVKEKVRNEGRPKPVRREPIGDPVTALLNDPTLRRGDVVIMPDGPKVFKGGRTTPYRLSDFEDVRRSKLVGAKTRRQLTAMPVQSRPAQVNSEVVERTPDKQDSPEGEQVAVEVTATGSVPRKVGP